MKNIVIFGASGGLGSDLVPLLEPHYRVTALSSKDVDITNREEVKRLFEENRFDIVLNMAAYNYNSTIHNYDDDKIEEVRRQVSVNIEGIINILSLLSASHARGEIRKNNFNIFDTCRQASCWNCHIFGVKVIYGNVYTNRRA